MKNIFILILFTYSLFSCACQTQVGPSFHFGFENIEKGNYPDKWHSRDTTDYTVKIDSSVKHSGNYSISIEAAKKPIDNSFGGCEYLIPAKYEGSQIEVRAYMKLQNVKNGSAGLVLKIVDENGVVLKFDNMLKKNVQGTSDWALYSVQLPLPENGKTISIGPILSGTGKLWADDIQLLIDGRDISKANLKIALLTKADSDHKFDQSSSIATIPLTPAKVEDLVILGKVWGFLKYYHPAAANGDYNWDYQLFRIAPQIIQCTSKNERNEILLKWALGIGEIISEITSGPNNLPVKLNPDISWIADKSELGSRLSDQLLKIKYAKRSVKNYYVSFDSSVGNPVFNEKSYYHLTIPDAGYRLLSLYRYWNIIQYFFPYKNLTDENWNIVLKKHIPGFIRADNELKYKLAVLSLITEVHDTHANIWGYQKSLQEFRGQNIAPLIISFVENKAVITGYLNNILGQKTGLKTGDIIETINGKSINTIIKEKLLYMPASNYPTQLRDLGKNLIRTNDTLLNVTYLHNRASYTKNIACVPLENQDVSAIHTKKDTCFKLLTPEIAYLLPGTIKNSYLPELMRKIVRAKGLIIDLRRYPSDFIVFTLGRYLMPTATPFVKSSTTNNHLPGLFTYNKPLKVGEYNPDYYKGKVVILVNESTQSQGEFTTMAFRVAPRAIVLGSTTAGADGNVSSFFLPGGISTMISGIGVYYPDGRETQRIGIVPDIVIRPTIKGIREGRDELIEKAIEIINRK